MTKSDRKRRPARRRRARSGGAALVELAIMLPLMIVLTLGSLDFSRFAYYYVATSNAAGAAARFAAFHPATPNTLPNLNAAVRQTAIDDLQGIVGYDVTKVYVPAVTITVDAPPYRFERVRVQVDYVFDTLVPWPAIPAQFTMSRAVEMRIVR